VNLCLGAIGQADVGYNLSSDWSTTSNPDGPWTYRPGSSALPLVSNYDFGETAPRRAFEHGAVLPGDVIVHSTGPFDGVRQGIANVIQTSPGTATIEVSGDIRWVRGWVA
jgi:hypothetical protein